MQEPPTAPTSVLPLIPANLHKEFSRLWENCLRTREAGIEHIMDYGRCLGAMRSFLKQFADFEENYTAVCQELEITVDKARRKINYALTWDALREHLDQVGVAVAMPKAVQHLYPLLEVPPEQRAQTWVTLYQEAVHTRTRITAKYIAEWIERQKALPPPSQPIQSDDFAEPETAQDELTEDEVPADAKDVTDAPADESTEAPTEKDEPPKPILRHPAVVLEAIERIVGLVGGKDTKLIEEWRRMISDPVKIKFEDLILWSRHSDEDVRRIATLISGNLETGLRRAMRIIDGTIDDRTPLSYLEYHCFAGGGRWEYIHAGYKILVTKLSQ